MIKLVSVLLTFVLFSLPNEVSAYFIDSTTVNGTAINSTKVNGTAVNSATVNGNPDIKAKKNSSNNLSALLFYRLQQRTKRSTA